MNPYLTTSITVYAMQAAKHGKSTLGIPKSVGSDFVAATKDVKSLPKKVKKGKEHGFTK